VRSGVYAMPVASRAASNGRPRMAAPAPRTMDGCLRERREAAPPADLRRTTRSIPLLPSGPGGVFDLSSRRRQRGHHELLKLAETAGYVRIIHDAHPSLRSGPTFGCPNCSPRPWGSPFLGRLRRPKSFRTILSFPTNLSNPRVPARTRCISWFSRKTGGEEGIRTLEAV
jgi:hypothetical protein